MGGCNRLFEELAMSAPCDYCSNFFSEELLEECDQCGNVFCEKCLPYPRQKQCEEFSPFKHFFCGVDCCESYEECDIRCSVSVTLREKRRHPHVENVLV